MFEKKREKKKKKEIDRINDMHNGKFIYKTLYTMCNYDHYFHESSQNNFLAKVRINWSQ